MADTIRESIIQSILTRLGTITKAAGYNYNSGANVFRAQHRVDLDDDLPAVVLWPQEEEGNSEYGIQVCLAKFRIESLNTFDVETENPSVVNEKLLGDIITCMIGGTTAISSYIDEIAYVSGGPSDIPNAGDNITATFAEFEVKYATTVGNPYEAA